jgi:KipI family sensor histidine kinase inhibitor
MTDADLPFGWRPYGDLGVLLELEDGVRALDWCRAIERSDLAATARPGWRSVLVSSSMALGPLIEALSALRPDEEAASPARAVEIRVVYDGEDLAEVAHRTGLGLHEVVERHAAPVYTVVCLGFSRAFPYLSGLDPVLRLPRRDTPRVRVIAGSVAIASDQTGIYPQPSPGGWHLLGRTTELLFDERSDPPSRLQPGDRVRFVPAAAP